MLMYSLIGDVSFDHMLQVVPTIISTITCYGRDSLSLHSYTILNIKR